MTDRTVVHDTFTHERRYPASPARVFAAFADPEIKRQWFGGPPEATADWSSDFRVGGSEHSKAVFEGGPVYRYDAVFQDIVEDRRIVYTYDMHLDEQRISVSVATVELVADGDGTLLVVTEQGAYLDGLDQPAMRAEGVGSQLDGLGRLLSGA